VKFAPVILVLAVGLTLAGCGPTAPPAESDSPSDAPTASGTPSPTTPPVVEGNACTRDDLDISFAFGDSSAGHMHGVLSMINSSTDMCTLNGYPILYMGSGEVAEPVGLPATSDGTSTPAGFALNPAAVATANVTITQAGIVDGCTLGTTTHLIAAPPQDAPFDWMASGRNVPINETPVCYNDDIGLLTVSALTLAG
jgi:hypothetical protein